MKIVIFAGGVGTRLWPLSRKNTPKQFSNIIGDKSMLQIAVSKLFPDFTWEDIYISTGKEYKNIVKTQLPNLPEKNILVEPKMRDVGPAVGLIIANFIKQDPDEPIVLLWGSDHLVKKEDTFRQALKVGEKLVREDSNRMIFVGQKPRFASQNLGYISFGQEVKQEGGIPVNEFLGFKYRPDPELANKFFTDGQHWWNLG